MIEMLMTADIFFSATPPMPPPLDGGRDPLATASNGYLT
jgi:hypothetical protein